MLDSIVPFVSTCPVFFLSPSLFWLLRKNMGAAWFLIILSVWKFSILMSFILQRQKTAQKLFLRKAGVSWKPTVESPAGLIHVHCISKENHLPKFRFRFIILIYKSTQNLFLVSVRKHKACFWIQGSILFFLFFKETIEPLIVEQNNSVHASQFWTTGFSVWKKKYQSKTFHEHC